ncbi:hypothetical protein VII00023_09369 [Vibrio ichthyoenteri ATCC 700023]|uniref:DUF218 domain-containing protein n=1 Tax=Vibrio ichthyoenteri ATCC 700023 TaxID=870968 RepID=F9S7C4_9VIBR|nr:YdcF family protein [Vibrio ichthyoenteri]EGU31538.1 hypothetical protein VII00023_09369 [Vibrio ichthyoenteri ATCC 700023]
MPSGNVKHVILVLGKRLLDNQLTAEGCSRVDALPAYLAPMDLSHTALIFCGGQLAGQTKSEAQAMAERFTERFSALANDFPSGYWLLEDQSTNTVENIQNAASKLIQSGLCSKQKKVQISLVSNGYHIERIIEIQKLMPQQGLLTTLKLRCQEAGLSVSISLDIEDHCSVEYPHQGASALAFLLLDELTTYRVYLEGVLAQVFSLPLSQVRGQPYQVATRAIRHLLTLDSTLDYRDELARLSAIIAASEPNCSQVLLERLYVEFNTILTQLNRRFDPESEYGLSSHAYCSEAESD